MIPSLIKSITGVGDYDVSKDGFLQYCPFSSYQISICAAFVVLKILVSGFFSTMLDVNSETKLLEAAIAA